MSTTHATQEDAIQTTSASADWWERGSLVVKTHGGEAGAMRLDLNFGKEHAAATVQEHARLQLPGETELLEPTEVEGSDGRYSVSYFSSDIANASHLPAEAALQWSGRTDHPLSRQLTIIDADVAEEQGSASAGDVHQAADRYPKTLLYAAVAGVVAIATGIVIYFLVSQ